MSALSEQENGFLAELDADPNNVELRLVFADWLEEQGDPRAFQIRQLVDFHQDKITRLDFSDPETLFASMRAFTPPTERVESLTDFQERLLPVWGDLWIQIAESVGETDREKAEQAVCDRYRCEGMKPPETFLWEKSPPAGICTASEIGAEEEEDFVTLRFALARVHEASDWIQQLVEERMNRRFTNRITQEIYEFTWRGVETELRHVDWERSLWDELENNELGTMSGYFVGDESYYQHVCGEQRYEPLRSHFSSTLHCGWWWPYERTVIICEKPVEQIRTFGKVTGHRYADGFEVNFDPDE